MRLNLRDPYHPLGFEKLPGFDRLFVDYVRGASARSFAWPTSSMRPSRGGRVELQPRPDRLSREVLCRLLTRQHVLFGGGAKALENIEALAHGSVGISLVTVSASTPGGTLQDLNKCLTAARVSRFLSDNGTPAIPMVWIGLDPSKPQERSRGNSSEIPLPPTSALIKRLGVSANEHETLGLLQTSYQEGDPSLALGRFLATVLSRWGMVFFAPHLDTAEANGLPGFTAERPPELQQATQKQAALLRQEGYGWPDEDIDYASLLYEEYRNRFWPIIARIVGEEELLRLAHCIPIFELFETPVAAAWPRASATLVDKRSQKTMERYLVSLPDLFLEFNQLLDRIAGADQSREASEKLQTLRDDLENRLSRLSVSLMDDGAALSDVIEGSREKMLYQIGKLEERFRHSLETRQSATARQLKRVCDILAPKRDLQERHISVPECLVRFSTDLPDRIYSEIDIWKWEHLILRAN